MQGYESIPSSKKEEFVEELSDASFVYAVKNDNTEETRLLKTSQIYFGDNDLKNYFNGYHSVFFVSDELYERFGEGRVKEFLKELGVEDKPRRIEIDANLSREEIEKLRGSSLYFGDRYQKDYEYEGLHNFINNITPEKSYLLWRLLLKSIESLSSWDVQEFFKGEYKWYYHFGNENSAKFDAKFLKTLKQQPWLVNKDNNFKKPSEITFSELAYDYIKERLNIGILIKALEFKPEIMDQLPENYRKILEIVKARNITTPEELEKILSEWEEKTLEKEKEQWMSECEPDDIIAPRMQEVEQPRVVTDDLSDQVEKVEEVRPEESTEDTEKPKKEAEKTLIDKKAIGEWGEKYVYNALKQRYQERGEVIEIDSGFKGVDTNGEEFEIIWLNKHQDKGKGYDFVIRKNGEEAEYIEVKAKTQESKELIEVTGTQWEWARKLFDQNKGEKYCFYIVSNAGKNNAKVCILRNPIKLWKEGKLYAHPVNFKL